MASMYCVKCRAKRDDPAAEKVTMKNGKPALKGKCPVCGTGMYKIGAAQSIYLKVCPSINGKKPPPFWKGFFIGNDPY